MKYLCLLRGINVSGQRKVSMPELRDLCCSIGFGNVSTYLLTGNIVLDSDQSADVISQRLSAAIRDAFHYHDVDVSVLDAQSLERILCAAPEQMVAGAGWHITFLMQRPQDDLMKNLNGEQFAPDVYYPGDGVIYVHCPNGYGRTRINNTYFEGKLKVRATTRNWNTIHVLQKMMTQ